MVMSEIIYHRRDSSAVTKYNGFIGKQSNTPKNTTKGWEVLIERKDEKTTWVDIKDIKEASPIEIDEYAVANQISNEPPFDWWAPYTLNKSDIIISK